VKTISTIRGLTLVGLILLALGVASAMWMETIRVNTYVHTGEVKLAWNDWSCSDMGIDPGLDKDVATCTVEPEEYDEEGNVIKVKITLDNAYPGYAPSITLYASNIGTVPVKLLSHDVSGLNETALEVTLYIPEDTQIDPEGELELGIGIRVLQGADELTTYTFEVAYTFAQWNEVG